MAMLFVEFVVLSWKEAFLTVLIHELLYLFAIWQVSARPILFSYVT